MIRIAECASHARAPRKNWENKTKSFAKKGRHGAPRLLDRVQGVSSSRRVSIGLVSALVCSASFGVPFRRQRRRWWRPSNMPQYHLCPLPVSTPHADNVHLCWKLPYVLFESFFSFLVTLKDDTDMLFMFKIWADTKNNGLL